MEKPPIRTGSGEHGHLVANGLSCARRHQHKTVPTLHRCLNGVWLFAAERVEAEDITKNLERIGVHDAILAGEVDPGLRAQSQSRVMTVADGSKGRDQSVTRAQNASGTANTNR